MSGIYGPIFGGSSSLNIIRIDPWGSFLQSTSCSVFATFKVHPKEVKSVHVAREVPKKSR